MVEHTDQQCVYAVLFVEEFFDHATESLLNGFFAHMYNETRRACTSID